MEEIIDKKGIWLDCDPGIDDAMALILASYDPSLFLVGVSTSSGNSNVENTSKNALKVLYGLNKLEVVVIKGSEHPLCYRKEEFKEAETFHGPDGLYIDWIVPEEHYKKIKNEDFVYEIYSRI